MLDEGSLTQEEFNILKKEIITKNKSNCEYQTNFKEEHDINKKPFYKRGWFIVLTVIIVVFYSLGSCGENKNKEKQVVEMETEIDIQEKVEKNKMIII